MVNEKKVKTLISTSDSTSRSLSTMVKLSLPIPPEADEIRDDLENVGILSLRKGQISKGVICDALSSVLNIPLSGPITPINDDSYPIPLASKEEVKKACSLGIFELSSKQGLCSMSVAPWSAEMGALGKDSGVSKWVHVWNVPLHG